MATLWIREYSHVGAAKAADQVYHKEGVPMVYEPGVADQVVTFSGSTQSAAFGATTTYITFSANSNFHYVVGPSPTATTNALMIPAGTLYSIGVQPGHKIAVVVASS
jgi:hypothetical protein